MALVTALARIAPLATGGPTPGVNLTPALTLHKPDGVGL